SEFYIMAELVQLGLESTLRELEEMERIELFNMKEIKSIIKRRKSLEYKLQRMQKSKEIYLKYIEFETNLLNLVLKKEERDLISSLFKAAKKRFPADEKLWLDDIEFCKTMKWFDTISVLYSKLLKVHSQNPSLWIMAAKWEMEEVKSPDNARKIFQRGVLLHPTSDTLWREFFRMELMYMDLIRKRRAILEPQSLKSTDAEDDIILNGQIAYIVYDKAVEEINDVEFALSFIQICLDFEFGSTFIENIFKYISEKFPDKEETLDAFAKKPLINVEEKIKAGKEMGVKKKVILEEINKEIHTKYEEAIEVLPTEKMWRFYIDFIFTLLKSTKESKKAKLQIMAINLMKAAAALNRLGGPYYSELVDMLFEIGDTEEALTTSLTSARKWNTVDLWYKCLTYHIQCMRELTEIYNLFEEALDSVNEKDSVTLWKLGVDWLSITSPEKLIELFEKGISKRVEISVPLKEMYLEICALKKGVTEARSLYKRFKKMGPLTPPIIKKMIRIEKAQLNVPIKALREYFEDGVREFGSENIGKSF
ncbi:u3 small nucleolar RNA-associated protein 6 homolog, partial [Trichonephila clavipes]